MLGFDDLFFKDGTHPSVKQSRVDHQVDKSFSGNDCLQDIDQVQVLLVLLHAVIHGDVGGGWEPDHDGPHEEAEHHQEDGPNQHARQRHRQRRDRGVLDSREIRLEAEGSSVRNIPLRGTSNFMELRRKQKSKKKIHLDFRGSFAKKQKLHAFSGCQNVRIYNVDLNHMILEGS